ncbi:hypothetical protein Pan241w_48950 [Gimesia alba]|uniref:Uncharacterized protein n=1 Tax=Gimesia alba TaxID=2527973 RepID=A0A517RLN6_9PLAN|nr:hypothetical protein [Gimesia alba]QDT44779.1 hypothetical protein Pan241w_48950 [Gimesia alba]
MLKHSNQIGLFCLLLLCGTLTRGEEDSQQNSNGWSSRPEENYKFLRRPLEARQSEAIRKTLPFRQIKLERRAPGGYSLETGKGFPAVIYYIEFNADGTALLHAISGTEKNGIYKGKIALTDYARLCLLYETLINEAGDPEKFGHVIQSSHPVTSELTLTFQKNQPIRKHRNDVNFGDFKFWVFENVFENIESKIKWVKVEG